MDTKKLLETYEMNKGRVAIITTERLKGFPYEGKIVLNLLHKKMIERGEITKIVIQLK